MKNLLSILSLLLLMSLAFTSCKKKEVLTAEDLTHNYVGCPGLATERAMGKVQATSTKASLTYSIVSQSLGTVLTINASTGEISVKGDTASIQQLSDAYYNNGANNIRKLTAVVAVNNGSETKNVNVTINLSFNCPA